MSDPKISLAQHESVVEWEGINPTEIPDSLRKKSFLNTAQQLLAGRIDGSVYNYRKGLIPADQFPETPKYPIYGINAMSNQLYAAGGPGQQSRMIRDKRKSLNRALLYSYQSAFVRKVYMEGLEEIPDTTIYRALINPDKLKMDYDDKMFSIGFESNFKGGDVFEWLNTGSYWIIRLQDLDELAYFRGDIRRCDYTIAWEDSEGNVHRTYAAIRGPVETKINYIQKHQISVDTPNHSLNIYMPRNKFTLEYFRRYAKFYLQDIEDGEQNICWRVEAIDPISTPGILEVTAVEYYANESEDDMEAGIVGALIVKHIEPEADDTRNTIVGKTFIKPKTKEEYRFDGALRAQWSYDSSLPLQVTVSDEDIRKVYIKWTSNYSGQFDIKYGEYTKTIVVESLF